MENKQRNKMKKILFIVAAASIVNFTSCQKNFLDLNPQDSFTDVAYFNRPADFKAFSLDFFSQLIGWRSPFGGNTIYNYMDVGSDLSASSLFSSAYARGAITIPTDDNRWNNPYNWIRKTN